MGISGLFETRAESRGDDDGSGRMVRSAADINPRARHPDMPPSGEARPLVYVLGEAPGEEEDAKGVQFVGKAGQLLRPLIPSSARARWNNTVRTRPVEFGGRGTLKNRQPSPGEVAFYRESLVRDIETSAPRLVLAFGLIPFSALLPELRGDFSAAQGQDFPTLIGRHPVWVRPLLHPSYILRIENQRKVDKIPGQEWKRYWISEVKRAVREAKALPPAEVYPAEEIQHGIELLRDPEVIVRRLRVWKQREEPGAFDFETSDLRPYGSAKLLTIAVAQGDQTIAFPLEHPDAKFAPSVIREIWEAFLDWLRSPAVRVAHNLAFELEWIAFRGGSLRPCPWGDTQAGAYVRDERPGGHSLEFVVRQLFGFALKELSSVNRKNLIREFVDVVLRYNALDAKFTLLAYRKQQAELGGLKGIYQEHIRRIPAAVGAQLRGLFVDQKATAVFSRELGAELDELRAAFNSFPEVVEYRRRRGPFNPASSQDLTFLFRDQLRRPEGKRGDKYSTDEEVLKTIDLPIAKAVLRFRGVAKLKSTYVDRMNPRHAETYVWPDGRLHPQFKTLATDTGRFASQDPNGQNWPKRKHAEIRKQVVPAPGSVFVSADYSQIEARVIAMFSRDRRLCEAIKDRYDIHMDWAERIVKAFPSILDRYKGGIKEFRKVDVKNAWTFPLFYGAKVPHVAALLEVPKPIVERLVDQFWRMFPEVLVWGESLRKSYAELGYVETLTGRRRRAPLSDNQIGNTPVQGTASDLVVDAGNRLSERAEMSGEWSFLQYGLNIHDDLTFEVPRVRLDDAIPEIVDSMVTFDYPWLNGIPIEIEVSVGKNWFEMKPIGKFASDE